MACPAGNLPHVGYANVVGGAAAHQPAPVLPPTWQATGETVYSPRTLSGEHRPTRKERLIRFGGRVVVALGYPVRLRSRVALVGSFVVGVLLILLLGQLAIAFTDARVVHVLFWTGWFGWQGAILPAHQLAIAPGAPHPYRAAFYRHILPGVSFGVAQMVRPWLVGITDGGTEWAPAALLFTGLVIVVVGAALLCSGFCAIGVAAAGFLYEYEPAPSWLRIRGVYRLMKHPLFVGGITVSIGAAMTTASPLAWWLAVVNLLALAVYHATEHRRCTLVLGAVYERYRAQREAQWTLLRARLGRPTVPADDR